jgi:protein involved in polysaccharide export with SLBB domain
MQRLIGQLRVSVQRWLLIVWPLLIFACAPTDTMRIDAANEQAVSASAASRESASAAELAKLERLWSERQIAALRNDDYPIGPGDVLTVSVPDIEQLAQWRARVSTRGTIELPLLGLLQAAGLTEDGLAAEIDSKLQKYMFQPQATVFVDEYHNRAVAVVGAVNRPGLVLLTSPSESLLDVITQAGGLSGAAADELILIPSRPGTIPNSARLASFSNSPLTGRVRNGTSGSSETSSDLTEPMAANSAASARGGHSDWSSSDESAQLAQHAAVVETSTASGWSSSAAPAQEAGQGAPALPGHNDAQFAPEVAHEARGAIAPLGRSNQGGVDDPAQALDSDQGLQMAGNDEAITIKIKGATLDGAGKYVNLPMRPGDVLIVPGGGDVMVVGWVHQPGRFQVGSGLTVLGALGAAGGPMYAAKTNSIVLIRTGQDGGKVTIPIDMEQITRGQTVDLPVQANDVIDVPYSGLRIGPYIFYSILTKVGLGGPVIPY